MSNTNKKVIGKCCEKCEWLEDGTYGHGFACRNKSCFCHIPSNICPHGAEENECPVINCANFTPSKQEALKKLLGKNSNIREEYGSYMSHYHCWHQNQPPACGIPLEKHKQCCLCDTPVPSKQEEKKDTYDVPSENETTFRIGGTNIPSPQPIRKKWAKTVNAKPLPKLEGEIEQEFLSRIDMRSPDECWIFKGGAKIGDYKEFRINKIQYKAHRLSYEYFNKKKLSDILVVDHLCRNTWCVNPKHLEEVTVKENTMRGISFSALNKKKTHCVWGHEYTPENTIIVNKAGGRACRICKVARDVKKHQKRMKSGYYQLPHIKEASRLRHLKKRQNGNK